MIPMSAQRPTPQPGDSLICVPQAEFGALARTTTEAALLAIEVDCQLRIGQPIDPQLTRSLRVLAMALSQRLATMPAAAEVMPSIPQPAPDQAQAPESQV